MVDSFFLLAPMMAYAYLRLHLCPLTLNASPTSPMIYLTYAPQWTTEDDLRAVASSLGLKLRVASVTFSEHKVNGKSKG